MRRENSRSISEVIKELIEAYKLNDKLIESRIIISWKEVAGEYIAKHTNKVYIKDKVLYVKIHSSIIKQELRMVHDDLLNKINTLAGSQYIKRIIFI
jgi:predicted nucleic acid-binding Zn ribbon protein